MIFLTETDEKRYKATISEISKTKNIHRLADLVTEEGVVTLTQDQVKDIFH